MHKILVIRLYFPLDALHVSGYISPSTGATFISCTWHLVYAGICRYVWLLCGYSHTTSRRIGLVYIHIVIWRTVYTTSNLSNNFQCSPIINFSEICSVVVEMKSEDDRTNTAPSLRSLHSFNSQNLNICKAYCYARWSQSELFICLIRIRRVIKEKELKGVYVSHYFWMSHS